jgi:hypothetical protein
MLLFRFEIQDNIVQTKKQIIIKEIFAIFLYGKGGNQKKRRRDEFPTSQACAGLCWRNDEDFPFYT